MANPAEKNPGSAFIWAARCTTVILLLIVASWVSKLGGVSTTPDVLADGSKSTDRLFNWHPVLMVTGFGVLMTEAVLAYRIPAHMTHTRYGDKRPRLNRKTLTNTSYPETLIALLTRRERRKVVHWSLHSAAVLLIAFGLLAAFQSHNLKTPPIPNLYSPHSYLGLAVVSLMGLQVSEPALDPHTLASTTPSSNLFSPKKLMGPFAHTHDAN
jgi:hypothetical protein